VGGRLKDRLDERVLPKWSVGFHGGGYSLFWINLNNYMDVLLLWKTEQLVLSSGLRTPREEGGA